MFGAGLPTPPTEGLRMPVRRTKPIQTLEIARTNPISASILRERTQFQHPFCANKPNFWDFRQPRCVGSRTANLREQTQFWHPFCANEPNLEEVRQECRTLNLRERTQFSTPGERENPESDVTAAERHFDLNRREGAAYTRFVPGRPDCCDAGGSSAPQVLNGELTR
jgi:hypothetical protein